MFKVGDIVRGNSKNYRLTNDEMTRGMVMNVENKSMKVKILEHETNKSTIGTSHWVSKKDFKLAQERNEV